VASAENSKHCVAFASGSAATSAVIHLLQHGDHVLCVDDVYGGTQRYFRKIVSPQMGIDIDFVDFQKDGVPLKDSTKLIWLETPTNPTLKITDIQMVANKLNGPRLPSCRGQHILFPILSEPIEPRSRSGGTLSQPSTSGDTPMLSWALCAVTETTSIETPFHSERHWSCAFAL
jgi:cystathionine gamma-lyase